MMAQCKLCGLLVGAQSVTAPAEERFAAASLACFLHLLQFHPEHVQAAINPLLGLVGNYASSLAFGSSDPEWLLQQQSAAARACDTLARLSWDDLQQQFHLVEDRDTPILHSGPGNDRK
jgi:hypothetical protein